MQTPAQGREPMGIFQNGGCSSITAISKSSQKDCMGTRLGHKQSGHACVVASVFCLRLRKHFTSERKKRARARRAQKKPQIFIFLRLRQLDIQTCSSFPFASQV